MSLTYTKPTSSVSVSHVPLELTHIKEPAKAVLPPAVLDLLKFLQVLFSDKVIISHDLTAKTSRILTPEQGEAYIERFLPSHLMRMTLKVAL